MFVLDGQYTSKELLDFLETSGEPVLDNQAARDLSAEHRLNLASTLQPGERIVCASELHLDQAKELCNPETRRFIELCKDKVAMREALRPLYPDFVFAQYTADELRKIDPASVAYPVVVKPATGFFSLGIYTLYDEEGWHRMLDDIAQHSAQWVRLYNETVIKDDVFIMESYIQGDEFALDMYYDEVGEPVILNLFAHAFDGPNDTSDRLYYCSKQVMEEQFQRMLTFLKDVNGILDFKEVPIHIEVRVTEEGRVIPIEFNPLRFAGICNTDLSWFAWGHKTYEMYLRRQRPDWSQILGDKDGLVFAMIILQKEGFDPSVPYTFDYEAACAGLSHVLDLRKLDYATQGAFCFIFAEAREEDWDKELGFLLRHPLDDFIHQDGVAG